MTMKLKQCILLLVLMSAFSFVHAQNHPILGYYWLGMTEEEHYQQALKMKDATEVGKPDEVPGRYLLSIAGIDFDAETTSVNWAEPITLDDYLQYLKNPSPLFFTGRSYFYEGKLVSLTIYTPSPNELEGFLCYMPKTVLPDDKEGENRTSYAVFNVEKHNKLVDLTNQVVTYLNKRYGKPQKEYVIPLLSALKKGEDSKPLDSKWFRLCSGLAVLPRAEWQQGKMKIIVGISNFAKLFILFYDAEVVSPTGLSSLTKPETSVKATAEW